MHLFGKQSCPGCGISNLLTVVFKMKAIVAMWVWPTSSWKWRLQLRSGLFKVENDQLPFSNDHSNWKMISFNLERPIALCKRLLLLKKWSFYVCERPLAICKIPTFICKWLFPIYKRRFAKHKWPNFLCKPPLLLLTGMIIICQPISILYWISQTSISIYHLDTEVFFTHGYSESESAITVLHTPFQFGDRQLLFQSWYCDGPTAGKRDCN